MNWRIENAKPLPVLRELPPGLAQTCITSPPPWSNTRAGSDCLAYAPSPEAYVGQVVEVMREVARVLRQDGTLWLKLAEPCPASGSGSDPIGLPWRVALALKADGWSLRTDILVVQYAPAPERRTDRPTSAHEYLFLLAKQPGSYYYDAAVSEPAARREWPSRRTHRERLALSRPATHTSGSWRRSWGLLCSDARQTSRGIFPAALAKRCVLSGSAPRACGACGTPWKRDRLGDWSPACAHHNPAGRSLVLDPFCATATTGVIATALGRSFLGIEQSRETVQLARRRLHTTKQGAR